MVEQQENNGGNGPFKSFLYNAAMAFIAFYLIRQVFSPQAPQTSNNNTEVAYFRNGIPNGFKMDLYIYIINNNSKELVRCANCETDYIYSAQSLEYGSWDNLNYRSGSVNFLNIPYNSSLSAQLVYLKHGSDPKLAHEFIEDTFHHLSESNLNDNHTGVKDAQGTKLKAPDAFTIVHPLTEVSKLKIDTKQNLLSQEEVKKEVKADVYLAHWKGNLTASIIQDFSPITLNGPHDQLVFQHYKVIDRHSYLPPVVVNDFWIFKDQYLPLNETSQNLTLDIHYEPLSLMKFTYYVQMENSLMMQTSLVGEDEASADDVKRIFADNPPWLLVLTFTISILHTVLDVLAFKNEIQFWKSRKTMEGLSLKSMYINLASNAIIFLYLVDNDASWMVLISTALGTIIEAWKITKAVHVSVRRWVGFIPIPQLSERNSYKSTKKYDDEAMKYLYYSLYPIIIGYAIYSLIYETHKSWYSWIISSLAGCVYVFGFIMLTPQLFINYRMKSVSHLPWRTFVYKAINTFIDDLFAFIIPMPTMHRLRCLRDDVIFFIYLYQRWIYPVDKNRVEAAGGELGESIDLDAWEELEKLSKLSPTTTESTQEEVVENHEKED